MSEDERIGMWAALEVSTKKNSADKAVVSLFSHTKFDAIGDRL